MQIDTSRPVNMMTSIFIQFWQRADGFKHLKEPFEVLYLHALFKIFFVHPTLLTFYY